MSLDGVKRMRLDDKVDFWPRTRAWRALLAGQEGIGATSMLAFLVEERERSGQSVPKPVPVKTQRRVICNYCKGAAQVHGGKDVHPHKDLTERNFWICWSCNAWVGCHVGGDWHQSLGDLANEEVPAARMSAHTGFDPLWERRRDE